MDWNSPFIVYRMSENGKLEEVFHAEDLKKAKYWLSYIANPGDVLCQTPAHPRHNGEVPKYWSHKLGSGQTSSDENDWKSYAKQADWKEEFPKEQQRESDS